jgi:Mrp family chromosome partitioning ATPase
MPEIQPMSFPEALQNRPGMQAAEDMARELALLGYLGRGKVLMIHGAEGDARTALHAMRFGRRLVREGAAVVVDLVGLSDLYTRVLGNDLAGLTDYLRGEASLGDIIHRDPKSPLDVVIAGEALTRQLHSPDLRNEVIGVIEALSESYGFVIIDAGTVGGVGEALAPMADLFALLTRRHPEDDALFAISERLEAARGAQVVLVPDEAANASAPRGASNGLFRFDQG